MVTDRIESDGRDLVSVAFPEGQSEIPTDRLEPVLGGADRLADALTGTFQFDRHRVWMRREAIRLQDAYRNDPAAALSNSRVEPKHHQVSAALRALEKSQARLILADEVGLGKTVEAGLVLKELRARGVLDRVLIIVPANLITQWQHELSSKFNENFVYVNSERLRWIEQQQGSDLNPWSMGSNVICSIQFARLDPQRERIAAANWDLVIVDEAHHARRQQESGSNKGYQLLELMRDQVPGLLLLTATPMQLHDYELYSMVELVAPGLYRDYEDFCDDRQAIVAINDHMAWLRLPPGDHDRAQELYAMLRDLDVPEEILYLDPSTPADRAELVAWCEKQHRLSDALVRNRKAEVGGFTQRIARRIPVEPTAEEKALAHQVQEYIAREYAHSPAKGLVLVVFQKMLASSSEALARALDNRAKRLLAQVAEDIDELSDDPDVTEEILRAVVAKSHDAEAEAVILQGLASTARTTEDSKLTGLDSALSELLENNPNEKVLIFTQFIGTLEMIQERIKDRFDTVVFHGGLSISEKDSARQAFRDHAQVMISSEAGGEGRNFQFCHILVNYDLPWNPMRIEQRIGRLDRVGQTENVVIHNFELKGTLDERILDILEHRIRIFTETVGALDPILGEVERRIEEIYLQDPRAMPDEFTRFEVDLETRLEQARRREEQLRDFILDAKSFRRDEAEALIGRMPRATPQDLEAFVRAALEPYPAGKVEQLEQGILQVTVPPALVRRARERWGNRSLLVSYRGTFDHTMALVEEQVDFFAFGHPLVDLLVELANEDSVPALPVLEVSNSPGQGIIFDYRVRFRGIRDSDWVLSHFVDGSGPQDPPPITPPPAGRIECSLQTLEGPWLEEVEAASRERARADMGDEYVKFCADNEATFERERERLEKLFAFQARYFENRIDRNQKLIDFWKTFGTEDQQRTIPAREGQIRQDRERMDRIEADREDAIAQLRDKREPSDELSLLGATLIVPTGELKSFRE